jgi:hypothetical protein
VILTTPAGRLSRLNKPKIAAGSARYKRRKISSKPTKGKGTTKGRNFGKLAQLMNMPLDVFFEARVFALSAVRFDQPILDYLAT